MVTKADNTVLDLVNPPISNMVLLHGTLDNVRIGQSVPAPAYFSAITDVAIESPLVGAPANLLNQVFLGFGLAMEVINGQNYLYVTLQPAPPPPGPGQVNSNDVLREDDTYVLREDTAKIVREHDGV